MTDHLRKVFRLQLGRNRTATLFKCNVRLTADAAERRKHNVVGIAPQSDCAADNLELQRTDVLFVSVVSRHFCIQYIGTANVEPHRRSVSLPQRKVDNLTVVNALAACLIMANGLMQGLIAAPLTEDAEVFRHSDTGQRCVTLQLAIEKSLCLGLLHFKYGICPNNDLAVILKTVLFIMTNNISAEVSPPRGTVLALVLRKLLAMYGDESARLHNAVELGREIVHLLEKFSRVLAISHIAQVIGIYV